MTADRHSGGSELFSQIRSPSCVLADLEECRLGAVVQQRFEHHRRVSRPGAIVEGQNHFPIAQKIRESPSASGLLHAATGFGVGAEKARATAIVLFCAPVAGANGAAAFVAWDCSGALSVLATATVFCEDDTRAPAAVNGTGSVAFCFTMTPNPTSPNVSAATKTTTNMRIATSI